MKFLGCVLHNQIPENLLIYKSPANITDLNGTNKIRIVNDDIYYLVFLNQNNYSATVNLTVTKEEISSKAYIFGGVVSVVTIGLVILIIRKRSVLISHGVEEAVLEHTDESSN